MRHLSLPPSGRVEMTPRAATTANTNAHSFRLGASLTSNLLGTTSGSEGVAKVRQSSLPPLGPPRSDTRPQATEKRTEPSSLGVQRAAARDAMQEASDWACQSMQLAHSPPMQSQLSCSHPRPLEISSALLVSGKTRDGFPRNAPLMLPRATALGSGVNVERRASDQQRLGASPNTIGDHKASRSTVSGAGVEIVLVDLGMPRDVGKMANTGGKGGRTSSISRRPPRHSDTPEADAQAFRDLLGGTTRKDARREGEGQEAGSAGAVGVEEGARTLIAGRVRIMQEEGGSSRTPGLVQPALPREYNMAAIMSQRLAVSLDNCLYDSTLHA